VIKQGKIPVHFTAGKNKLVNIYCFIATQWKDGLMVEIIYDNEKPLVFGTKSG